MLRAKEKLLRAAVKVFAEKGFSGASTREIARRARVNPVTLFRTFNSKEQLHAAAVDYMIGGLQLRKQVDALAQRGDPAPQFIAGVIKLLVDTSFNTPELQRIILNAALEKSEVAYTAIWGRLAPIIKRIQTHLSEYIAKGELRKVDPLVAARLIVSTAVYHYQLYELLGAKLVAGFNQPDLSDRYTDIIYDGLKP
ncbi:MAG: TetR/AcrR family transcriptional regulator [Terriglobales bacterium]